MTCPDCEELRKRLSEAQSENKAIYERAHMLERDLAEERQEHQATLALARADRQYAERLHSLLVEARSAIDEPLRAVSAKNLMERIDAALAKNPGTTGQPTDSEGLRDSASGPVGLGPDIELTAGCPHVAGCPICDDGASSNSSGVVKEKT